MVARIPRRPTRGQEVNVSEDTRAAAGAAAAAAAEALLQGKFGTQAEHGPGGPSGLAAEGAASSAPIRHFESGSYPSSL